MKKRKLRTRYAATLKRAKRVQRKAAAKKATNAFKLPHTPFW